MAIQTAGNVLIAIKRETTTGVAATAAGASQLRPVDSQGLEYKRSQIQSAELRRDMVQGLARLGGKSADGSYSAEATVGGVTDICAEAIARGTWVAAVAILPATATSITTPTTSTLARAAGSWITDGVRVGDVITISNQDVGNEGLRLRVTIVTALTLTVAGTPLTVNAVADTTFTVTILKKVIAPAIPTRYSHTIEQYDMDIDISELFLGCRLVQFNVSCKPGQMAMLQYTFQALDRTKLVNATSPWFTTPAVTTGLALTADDSVILQAGVVQTTFTGFDLTFQITADGVPVIGNYVSPDVFDAILSVTGTITGLRSDFSQLILFDAETTFSLGLLLLEPGAAPQACFSIYLPVVKIGALSAPAIGASGAKVETRTLMVGPQAAATGFDGTIAAFQSSAP